MKFLSRIVWIVSLVSLLTDISSEMLYPVMPLYLQSVGFTALWIGVLEGFAEGIVGLSKGYFGNLSDRMGNRVLFIRTGYFLSSLSKPMMAVLTFPAWIFFTRLTDRLGKGIRTAARDALLSEESSKEDKGKIFGFHRGMDTLGAAIGPIMALVFLGMYPGEYKPLFFLAFIPAITGVAFTFLLKNSKDLLVREKSVKFSNPFTYLSYWKEASPQFRNMITGVLLFTLFNSSDIFLFLVAKAKGMDDLNILKAYIFYNLVYALSSYPAGVLADKVGKKAVFIGGLILFSIVYFGFAWADKESIYLLFLLYGIYAAATEGISKAWASCLLPDDKIGTGLGLFSSLTSIALILASSFAGFLYSYVSLEAPFIAAGSAAIISAGYLFFKAKEA